MQTANPFRRALATNSSDANFVSKAATITEPTNDGVLTLVPSSGGLFPERLELIPFGVSAANDTFSMRVLGWSPVLLDTKTTLWVPVTLGEFACTLGAMTGVAGAAVLNTELFVDTITMVAARNEDRVIGAGTAVNSDTYVNSPANDTPAHIRLRISGYQKVEFIFDQTLNTPTMNTLYRYIDDDPS